MDVIKSNSKESIGIHIPIFPRTKSRKDKKEKGKTIQKDKLWNLINISFKSM